MIGIVVLMVAVAVVLILGADALIWYFRPGDAIVALVQVAIGLALLLIPLRALFQPLILHYGTANADDTHGSAASPPMRRPAN